MGSHPVTISRASAEAIAAGLHTEPDYVPGSAIAELDAAMSDAAEAAAWEPLRPYVLAYIERDRGLDPANRAALDQLVAAMRTSFADQGMAIDDPVVVRSILVTVSVLVGYSWDSVRTGEIGAGAYDGICEAANAVTMAASRLVDPAVLA